MADFAPLPEFLDVYCSMPKGDLSTTAQARRKYVIPSSDAVDPETPSTGPRIEFRNRARFWWKTFILAATTLALIPILLLQSEVGATIYLWALVAIHIIGLGVFIIGVSRDDIAPSTWGFVGRIIGLVVVAALLYLVSKGLQTDVGSAVFWISLFAIWAVHTAGLLMLHLRGRNETSCPFV